MFRLLIVEDEENSRKGLKATLAPIPNLEIDTASDGREGYLKAIRWNPDIIISDAINGLKQSKRDREKSPVFLLK